jgi:methyl-accepting chemotaxis protein
MTTLYLSDHGRYQLYGLDDGAAAAVLARIAAGGLDFVREGVAACVAAIALNKGAGESYRIHGAEIEALMVSHFSEIISPRFVERQSDSNRRAVAGLSALGIDMRAIIAGSSFVIDAFIRRRLAGVWLGAARASLEVSALQRALICDIATAFIYDQQRIMQAAEARSGRLTDQLANFRAVIASVSGELAQASGSVQDAMNVVAGSTAEALSRSKVSAAATDHGNRNLTSSAASTEELASSISELTRQSELSRAVVERVGRAVDDATTAIADLQSSAGKIGSIVDLISRIAEQTNLLSLNATIEAARAGEAGRGFAVVAQEVKALANQTTRATQDIVEQIGAVQTATARSVTEMAGIGDAMAEMARNASEVAAAVAQQNDLTAELSRNLHETVHQVVSASEGYFAASSLIEAAGSETERLRHAVAMLSRIGGTLIGDVDSFTARIKAA